MQFPEVASVRERGLALINSGAGCNHW